MATFNCNICGGKVDMNSGGLAMMLTFCNKRTTSLINVSFCGECYKKHIDKRMREMNDAGRLGISFESGSGDGKI